MKNYNFGARAGAGVILLVVLHISIVLFGIFFSNIGLAVVSFLFVALQLWRFNCLIQKGGILQNGWCTQRLMSTSAQTTNLLRKVLYHLLLILLLACCCLLVKASVKPGGVSRSFTLQCHRGASVKTHAALPAEAPIVAKEQVHSRVFTPNSFKPFATGIYAFCHWLAHPAIHSLKLTMPYATHVAFLRTHKLMLFPFHGFW